MLCMYYSISMHLLSEQPILKLIKSQILWAFIFADLKFAKHILCWYRVHNCNRKINYKTYCPFMQAACPGVQL